MYSLCLQKMTLGRLGLHYQIYHKARSVVTRTCFSHQNEAFIHKRQTCILPSVSIFFDLEPRRTFVSGFALNSKSKVRKQVKNKALKKDPNYDPTAIKLGSFQDKYKNKVKISRTVDLWYSITLKELASRLEVDVDELFDIVLSLKNVDTDYIVSEDQELCDKKLFNALASKLHYKNNYIENPKKKIDKLQIDKDVKRDPPAAEEDLRSRPPVITIMGHIDHGKTSLLDHLRHSRIVAGEHGGITQHIGAFSVALQSGHSVTFIDTPGHAAFTAMRTRGATSTDIVILIVDACEGVLEQTLESLRIIRQARVPFIVAINKIDKAGADVEATKRQLEAEGVRMEDTGGDVQCVPISAVMGTNIDQLIEAILLQAELLELKCDVVGRAEGVVIESQVEQGLGKTASVLLQRGVVRPGSCLVAASTWCKIRMMLDDQGRKLTELKPSEAAKIVGWRGENVPSAGTEVLAVESEQRAKEVVDYRQAVAIREFSEHQQSIVEEHRKQDRELYNEYRKKKLERGWIKLKYGKHGHTRKRETEEKDGKPVVNVIIKGDVDGSIEAILSCLETYQEDEVNLDIVDFGVGEVSEGDLSMAESFDAIIYAFNANINPKLQKQAEAMKVPVRTYNVIYHLIGDLRQEITSKMPPLEVETVLGRANVIQEFKIKDKKNLINVAGCRVVNGKLLRSSEIKVMRGQECVYQGGLASLKHLKDEVSEIVQNQECGLRVQDQSLVFQPDDVILAVETRQEPNSCKWDPGF